MKRTDPMALRARYEAGESINALSADVGLSYSQVRKRLVRAGTAFRDHLGRPRASGVPRTGRTRGGTSG
jgi:hypothetical protein